MIEITKFKSGRMDIGMNLDVTGLTQTSIRNVIYDIEHGQERLGRSITEIGLEQIGPRTGLRLR